MKAHHDQTPVDGETLKDIEGLVIDHFWSKCEQHLPEAWSLTLRSRPVEGHLIYQALAVLEDWSETTPRPMVMSEWRSMPERALEQLFYRLRDGLAS